MATDIQRFEAVSVEAFQEAQECWTIEHEISEEGRLPK